LLDGGPFDNTGCTNLVEGNASFVVSSNVDRAGAVGSRVIG
jgi:hypothetical protein